MAAIHSKVYETNFNELNEAHLDLNYSCSQAIKAFVAITSVTGQQIKARTFNRGAEINTGIKMPSPGLG